MLAAPPLAAVEARLHALYVGVAEAGLRDDHRKKAREVTALLGEAAVSLRRARATPTIVDAAAGKGYVGLLAAELLLAPAGRAGHVVVIERDGARADLVRAAAAACTAPGVTVEVVAGEIAGEAAGAAWPDEPDLVMALHACGPAADDVIARALAARATALLLVPCCYGAAVVAESAAERIRVGLGVPDHAPVRRRFAQAIVDSERTLRLEAAGYETRVVELVAPRITPHNLLWRAMRVGEPVRMQRAAEAHARLLGG